MIIGNRTSRMLHSRLSASSLSHSYARTDPGVPPARQAHRARVDQRLGAPGAPPYQCTVCSQAAAAWPVRTTPPDGTNGPAASAGAGLCPISNRSSRRATPEEPEPTLAHAATTGTAPRGRRSARGWPAGARGGRSVRHDPSALARRSCHGTGRVSRHRLREPWCRPGCEPR